jgi:hypothetical protein
MSDYLRPARLALAAALMLSSAAALAAEPARREAAAHVHGVASVNAALDGTSLTVELESPAESILGFEHAPKSQAEKDAVAAALTSLKSGEKLFNLPAAAGCVLKETDIDMPSGFADGKAGHKDHAHKHDHAGDTGEGHADIDGSWRFTCAKPSAITSFGLGLFSAFPRMEKVNVVWLAAGAQKAGVLTPAATVLDLR